MHNCCLARFLKLPSIWGTTCRPQRTGQPGTAASAPLYPAVADPDVGPAQGDHCVMPRAAETITTFLVRAELLQLSGSPLIQLSPEGELPASTSVDIRTSHPVIHIVTSWCRVDEWSVERSATPYRQLWRAVCCSPGRGSQRPSGAVCASPPRQLHFPCGPKQAAEAYRL